jgi:predicted membrane metal-binding protein
VLSPYDLRALLQDRTELLDIRGRLVETPSLRIVERNEKESRHALAEMEINAVRRRNENWQPAFGHVMTRTADVIGSNFFAGQIIEVVGVAQVPAPPIAPGVFDYARYLEQRRIHYELKVASGKDWQIISRKNSPPVSDRFLAWGQRTLARGLPSQDESLRLQWAMLLGWQTALTSEVSEPFMRSGTMHIFAISGLHIALIAGIFAALLRALALPRAVCGAIIIPIIWGYTAAT